jgi:3-deoxy-D-manno-octulosonic-acid transferase
MFTLYSFLLTVGFFILSPRFLLDALRRGKYAAGFRERMGRLPAFDAQGKPVIWLHCVSVGETQAARPLADELLKNFPGHKLVISTITKTGQELARELFADKAALIFYFPFDWKFSVRRALKAIKPQAILLVETELWFRFLREAHQSGAKVAIVNGRLSERSLNGYSWIKKFMRRALGYVDLALMQNAEDAGRIKVLGIKNSRVRVTGNLKFDLVTGEQESALTEELRARFAVSPDVPLIAAVSTHAPEESLILEVFRIVNDAADNSRCRLLIAPRHPERFEKVAEEISEFGFRSVRRSAEPGAADKTADVILLDTIGELRGVLPLAEIVFVGGSLIPHGGQNILEPAAAQKAIVTGPYTMNFSAILSEFLAKEAIIQLPRANEAEICVKLTKTFAMLLEKPEVREKLAANAAALIKTNSGATLKTIDYLKPLIKVDKRK